MRNFVLEGQCMADTITTENLKGTLIIGKTGWGKTTFTQKLAKNKMFGDLKEIYWIKKIPPSAQREKNILVFKKTLILSIHKL